VSNRIKLRVSGLIDGEKASSEIMHYGKVTCQSKGRVTFDERIAHLHPTLTKVEDSLDRCTKRSIFNDLD